ncbi:GAF domain-containing protein [Actinoplanes sp. CA-030573]|uniref:GAF domain-containing protein n=1 Tax=Actinoplanes sp. CA-030573 TaxID=3239898 RepID=UPI003D8ABB31
MSLPHAHQRIIDAEMRASRRELLRQFRRELRRDPETLVAPRFLDVADWPAVCTAITIAAGGGADACALHAPSPYTSVWRIVRHRGLPAALLDHLSTVGPTRPSVLSAVLSTGAPLRIDDLTVSPILAGEPGPGLMLAAGIRSVHSYPLHHPQGSLLAVLTLYNRTKGRHPAHARLAKVAAEALATSATRSPSRPPVTASRTAAP